MFTQQEAKVISRYLLKVDIDQKQVDLYAQTIASGDFQLSIFEQRIFRHQIQRPIHCAAYDAILGWTHPNGNIRKRFFLMFSILETTPQFSDHFLGVHNKLACIRIGFVGIIKYLFHLSLGILFLTFQFIIHRLCTPFMTASS